MFEADFPSFTTPGECQLVDPGYGASLPFLINEGIAMNFTRTYAQGLYHQRCGTDCKLPFTRHIHGACHTAQAEIPSPQLSCSFIYTTIAGNLPAGGQWVKLEVPADAVGLEGSKTHGMSFSAFGGRVPRDATGKTSPAN